MTNKELEKEVKELRQVITEIQIILNTNSIKRKPGYITGTEYAEKQNYATYQDLQKWRKEHECK